MDESSNLSGADRACAAGAEDDLSLCFGSVIISKSADAALPKMPSRQTLETYSLFDKGIMMVER